MIVDLEDCIINLVDKVMVDSFMIQGYEREKLTLLMPEYFFQMFKQAIITKFPMKTNTDFGSTRQYRGVKIQFGYENKIILFHEDYPRTLNPLFKLSIQIP